MTKFRTLVCLISFVLVLSLACPVQATDNHWTNLLGDNVWNAAGNWDDWADDPDIDHVPAIGDGENVWIEGGPGDAVVSVAGMGAMQVEMAQGGVLTVASSGELEIEYSVHMGNDWAAAAPSVVNVNGILTSSGPSGYQESSGIHVGSGFYWGMGEGTLNVNAGGTVNTAGLYVGSYAGTGHVQLDSGVINTDLFMMVIGPSTVGTMDITGTGTMIIDGNKTSAIGVYIGNGWLTAGAGVPLYDYNTSNLGKTTVYAPEPGVLVGDLDGDDDVDEFDLQIIIDNFGQYNLAGGLPKGDANADDWCNGLDLDIVQAAWTGPGAASVPEPGSLVLLAFGSLVILLLRRRSV